MCIPMTCGLPTILLCWRCSLCDDKYSSKESFIGSWIQEHIYFPQVHIHSARHVPYLGEWFDKHMSTVIGWSLWFGADCRCTRHVCMRVLSTCFKHKPLVVYRNSVLSRDHLTSLQMLNKLLTIHMLAVATSYQLTALLSLSIRLAFVKLFMDQHEFNSP